MESELTFTQEYIARTFDVDHKDRLRLTSIFNFLQDSASIHAEKLGVGFEALKEKNLFWVLSFIKVDIDSYPKSKDVIQILTWPKCGHKLYSIRDFILFDNGKEFGRATSAWLMVDMNKRRVVDSKPYLEGIAYLSDKSAINVFPSKIILPEDKAFNYTKKIRYSDVDLNDHTNNVKYVELALNCIPFEKECKSIVLTFNSETKIDDVVDLYSSSSFNNYLVEGVNKELNKEVFKCRILT